MIERSSLGVNHCDGLSTGFASQYSILITGRRFSPPPTLYPWLVVHFGAERILLGLCVTILTCRTFTFCAARLIVWRQIAYLVLKSGTTAINWRYRVTVVALRAWVSIRHITHAQPSLSRLVIFLARPSMPATGCDPLRFLEAAVEGTGSEEKTIARDCHRIPLPVITLRGAPIMAST